ncbi:MAG: BrnT family toxin [Elstera sp.]
MKISFDPIKRQKTLEERGLDFADAARVFAGPHLTRIDDRRDYGAARFVSAGWLDTRRVILVWTERADSRRIISMRHAHDDDAHFTAENPLG